MANVLTPHIPDLQAALDIVSRELVGFIPAVAMDASLERAAKDEVINSFVAPASGAADIVAGQQAPNTGDQTLGNKQITIDKARAVPVRWNGEEQKGINNGIGFNKVFADQLAQAMRTLTNEVEADLAALYTEASNGVAPSGTTLFDAGLKDLAYARKCLVDNGAPLSDMQAVLGTMEGADLRSQSQLTNANEAGTTSMREQGVLLDVFGMKIRESGQRADHTFGTHAAATTDAAGYAIGDTVITLTAVGTGNIVAGDLIKFAGDDNEYVVASGDADVSNGGTITLAAPGLKVAIAGIVAISGTDYTQANMVFHRNAIQLITRVPAAPLNGDAADDFIVMQDQHSGLAFELRAYKEYRQVHYELGLAWGMAVIKPEHLCLLVD